LPAAGSAAEFAERMHASIAHTEVHFASVGATVTMALARLVMMLAKPPLRLQCVDHGVGGDVVVRTRRIELTWSCGWAPDGLRSVAVRRGRVAAVIDLKLHAYLQGAIVRDARVLVIAPVEATLPVLCAARSTQAGRGTTRGHNDQHAQKKR